MSIKDFNKQTVSNLTFEAAVRPIAPTISGYSISGSDDTALDPAGGQTILVNGSGFRPGATITMNNVSISVVTFVSVDQLSFTSPAMSAGTYNLFVVNTDNGAAILAPGIVYSTFPTWTTAQGTLGSYYETTSISETVEATGDAPITYTLVSGSLPSGASLASDGTITGTSPIDNSSTTYSFTIQADDAESQSSTRSFSLTINTDVVTWVTPSSGATIALDGASYSQALSATDAAGYSVSYTANALPTGLTLDSGIISGTSTIEGTTTTLLTATAATTNRSATNTITWVVSLGDIYWKNVSLLLNGVTPTTTFINDASLNNSQLTIAGDTRPNNFNPYEEGYYSNYFNGSTDYLSPSTSLTHTGDFTVEFWFNTSAAINAQRFPSMYIAGSNLYIQYDHENNAGDKLRVLAGSLLLAPSTTLNPNTWHHVALVRSGSTITLYCDGVSLASGTDSSSIGGTVYISSTSTTAWAGYISNLRVVNGTALYTSAFTPSTTPLTVIANTVLLTCQSNRFIDNSTNNATITKGGDTKVSSAYPFTTPTTAAYNTQYSTYFDGTGDYLTVSGTSGYDIDSATDYTVEAWIYNTGGAGSTRVMVSKDWSSGTTYASFGFSITDTNKLGFVIGSGSTSSTGNQTMFGVGTISLNTWYHVAFVKSSTTYTFYINGSIDATGSVTGSSGVQSNVIQIGRCDNGFPYTGIISNLRIVKTAVYTGAFTTPTNPLSATQSSGTNISAITGTSTSLLTCQDSTLKDNSPNAFTITSADQARPIAVSPFTMTTSDITVTSLGSAYFDGSGDYLSLSSAIVPATGNFTIECWVYSLTKAGSAQRVIYAQWVSAQSGRFMFGLDQTSSSRIWLHYNGTDYVGTTGGIIPDTWTHVALVRNGDVFNMYVNGLLNATNTFSGASLYQVAGSIGAAASNYYILALINDLRIVTGTGIYTANFLPPQAPLTPVTNTQLLTCQYNSGANNNSFVDQSSFNNIITRAGNTTQGTFSPFSQTGWSNYFDGSSTYYFGSSVKLNPEAGAYTVEGWVNVPIGTNNKQFFVGSILIGTGGYSGSTVGALRMYDGSSTFVSNSSYLIATGTWNHFAIVREGTGSNQLKMYINGILVTVGTSTNSPGTATYNYIGSVNTSTDLLTGYISNLRFVKGTAVYTTASTTIGTQIFTPPTSPLTAIANTQLLVCQSNRFIDNSPNDFTPTISATPSVQAFSPFGGVTSVPTSYSNYFDGTGDSLSTTCDLGTSEFTAECWGYMPNTATGSQQVLVSQYITAPNGRWAITVSTSGYPEFVVNGLTEGNLNIVAGTIAQSGVWHHFAVTRNSSNVFTFWVNGVSVGTGTRSGSLPSSSVGLTIGGLGNAGGTLNLLTGYVSNLRIVKNTALYTSNFTPSTTPLTAIANTQLLTCQSATMIDNSTNNFVITATGDVKPKPFNPFGTTTTTNVSYTPSVNGGSMYFDGATDYLTAPVGCTVSGTTAYTIEFWIYRTAAPTLTRLFENGVNSTNFSMDLSTTGYITINNNTTIAGSQTTTTVPLNAWTHVALVRTSTSTNDTRWYINGVLAGTFTHAVNIVDAVMQIGRSGGGYYLTGYLTDLKFASNVLYTSNFYPSPAPATPTTTIGSTTYASKLLLNGTSGGIIDYHGTNNLETVGNTQLASEDPYAGSYYSNYFDGTGDVLSLANNSAFNFGSGDFTIECWFYISADSATNTDGNRVATLLTTLPASGTLTNDYSFTVSGNTTITGTAVAFNARYNGTNQSVAYTASIPKGVWHHFAATKTGNTATLYYDGNQVAQNTSFTNQVNSNGTDIKIGAANYGTYLQVLNGYISNLRIVKGSVLYTGSTYTVPTAPLPSVTGTSLLSCQSNKFIDNSTNNFAITKTGDVKVKSINPFQNNTGKSLYFDGTGDYLKWPSYQSVSFGTGDFTVESWCYLNTNTSSTAAMVVDSRNSSQTGSWAFGVGMSNAHGRFGWWTGSTAIEEATVVATPGVWYHIAYTRSGTTGRFFVNGTQVSTGTDSTNYSVLPTVSYVGGRYNQVDYVNGYIKDLRITKGVARYTTTFTPPTTPFKDK